jgi:hypothetical protein
MAAFAQHALARGALPLAGLAFFAVLREGSRRRCSLRGDGASSESSMIGAPLGLPIAAVYLVYEGARGCLGDRMMRNVGIAAKPCATSCIRSTIASETTTPLIARTFTSVDAAALTFCECHAARDRPI